MRNLSSLIYVIVLTLCSYPAISQLNPQGAAPGLQKSRSEFNTHNYPLLQKVSDLIAEDESGVDFGVPLRVAVSVPVNMDFFSMGEWFLLPDGGRYYRVQLSSENAYALSIAFEQFFIPEHALLFFYCPDKKHVFGGYTHIDNTPSGLFPSPVIDNDTVIIEYYEPSPKKIKKEPLLKIMEIAHFYRPVSEGLRNGQIGSSWPCHVNVNCSEGDEWQDMKRGVVRILLKMGEYYGWCSGSLINNTAQDGTPYLITAEHCAGAASADDRNLWQFRFNFERPGCDDVGLPPAQNIPGAQLIAMGPLENGSDLQLLKLNFLPPPSFQPYYNGWDRRVDAPHFGAGIHHPNGDVKKISTFSQPAVTVNNAVVSGYNLAYRSIWNVLYVATENGHGVTQGGSSGSPLFNHEKLIVGTLTGGNTSCTNTGGNNYYGKLNYHWESNGPLASEQLKPWLDPLGTRQQSLQGLNLYPAPPVRDLSGVINADTTVTLKWGMPAYEQLDSYWFSNVSNYSGIRFEGPERATKFMINDQLEADTFFIKSLSHIFWEHPNYLWGGDNTFFFKIYDDDGETILFESSPIPANNFHHTNTPVTLDLENHIAVTGDFYVAIVPGESGHPSSLAMDVYNVSSSYYGSPGNWLPLSFDQENFELLTGVFGSVTAETENAFVRTDAQKGSSSSNKKEHIIYLGYDIDQLMQSRCERMGIIANYQRILIDNVKYYNIYKDGVLIAQTDHAGIFEYIDKDGLELEETYTYYLTAVYDINPANPHSPDVESEASDPITVKITFDEDDTGLNPALSKEDAISIFPNPSGGVFRVKLPAQVMAGEVDIKVFDIGGRRANASSLDMNNVLTIDISSEPPGLYVIKFYTKYGVLTRRMIKI